MFWNAHETSLTFLSQQLLLVAPSVYLSIIYTAYALRLAVKLEPIQANFGREAMYILGWSSI